jgi:hypothetical protein
LDSAYRAYEEDEWLWIQRVCPVYLEEELRGRDSEALMRLADAYLTAEQRFLGLVRSDAEREFDRTSRTGFGADGDDDQAEADFLKVRGIVEDNSFVRDIEKRLADIGEQVEMFKKALAGKSGD